MKKRTCCICHYIKNIKEFYKDKIYNGKQYYKNSCKICYHFAAGRGINKKDYKKIFDEQNGKCAICNQSKILISDHDHKTGKVRGLLCTNCNLSLGMVENLGFFKYALLYLKRKPYKIEYYHQPIKVRKFPNGSEKE